MKFSFSIIVGVFLFVSLHSINSHDSTSILTSNPLKERGFTEKVASLDIQSNSDVISYLINQGDQQHIYISSPDKIYLNPEQIIFNKSMAYFQLNEITFVPLKEIYSDGYGCFIISSKIDQIDRGNKFYLEPKKLKYLYDGLYLEAVQFPHLPIFSLKKDEIGWYTLINEDLADSERLERKTDFFLLRDDILLCKSSEEWENEAKENKKEAVKEAIKGTIEGGISAFSLSKGHVGLGIAEGALAIDSFKSSWDKYQKSKECIENAEKERENENNYNEPKEMDSWDRPN